MVATAELATHAVLAVAPVLDDPLSVLLLATGVLLTVAPMAVAGYLVGGAFVDLFTPE